jgi:hypothetical protein
LSGILSLKPEDEKRLHPKALEWFNDRRAEIQFEAPLEELSDDDLNTFLSDDEKREFQSCMEEISKGLSKCINLDEASSDLVTNAIVGLSLVRFEVNSLLPMRRIRLLLKDVHQRKVAKVKEEQRERDEEDRKNREQAEAERRKNEAEQRWRAAYKKLNIPADDALRYLKSEEHKEFVDSILGAVDAYLAGGESYILDRRAKDYLTWISVINKRRKEEQGKITASLAAQKYNEHLNKEISRLKSVLCPSKKDLNAWFEKEIRDKRYTGHNFDYILSADEKEIFDGTLVSVANKKLEQLISNELRQFVDVPSQYWRVYFPLPSTSYSLEGTPCLDFCFDIFGSAYAEVWLKPGEKTFGNYVYNLPWRDEKGYPVPLKEPEFLGYYYLVFTPEDLGGYVFWQSIPLLLLRGLLGGETKPSGTTISAYSDGMITYKTQKFKEQVTIPDSFANYLRNIGNIDEMVSMGIMTGKVASVVKSELAELKIGHEALALEEKTKGKDTKKAKAFQLFSEGNGPSSPEVKALGLHKSTRFKYYNQYLAVHKP